MEPSDVSAPSDDEVLALVLTYNSTEGLSRCLEALQNQRPNPVPVLVVDNASDYDVGAVVQTFANATLLRLPENVGPAGGYAAGFRQYRESDYGWIWVMDDDCRPSQRALSDLMEKAGAWADQPFPPVLRPRALNDRTGEQLVGLGWCGVLIPRQAVESCGVPREDYFYWVEDTEYFTRLENRGFSSVDVATSTVEINVTRADTSRPAWKYYYMIRNTVYSRWQMYRGHTHHAFDRRGRYLQLWKGMRSIAALSARCMLREDEARTKKLLAIARGVFDGLRGHLGKTISPNDANRPSYLTPKPSEQTS